MKKNSRNLEVGDHVKESSFKLKRRVGQIITILDDSKKSPTLECILVHPKTLLPIENLFGQHKIFRVERALVKSYAPRHKLFEKKSFEIGSYIVYKGRTRTRYGRIICYLNQEEGLYPHSYDINKHNGKDLLECVQIDPSNLKRILDSDESPQIFIADPNKCKNAKVLDRDEKGRPLINLSLDLP
jgi:hypothetical protein